MSILSLLLPSLLLASLLSIISVPVHSKSERWSRQLRAAATQQSSPIVSAPLLSSPTDLIHLSPALSLSIEPSAVWASVTPACVVYSRQYLFVTAWIGSGDSQVVYKVDATTWTVAANASFNSMWVVESMYASHSSLFMLVVDLSVGKVWRIVEVEQDSLRVVSTVEMPYPLLLLGVDAAGGVLCTTVEKSSEVVWLNASTGARLAVHTGGLKQLQVVNGVFSPTTMDMLILDAGLSLHRVAADDQLVYSISLSIDVRALAVDEQGVYFYVMSDDNAWVFAQYEWSTGQPTGIVNVVQTDQFFPFDQLSAAAAPGDVYFVDAESSGVVLLHRNTTSSLVLSPYTELDQPFHVTAVIDGRILVSQVEPWGFIVLNATGQLVNVVEVGDPISLGCPYPWPLPDMAVVDETGEVLVNLCNGSIAVLDATLTVTRYIDLELGTVPSVIALTVDGSSAYIVDLAQPNAIDQYELKDGKKLRTLSLPLHNGTAGDVEVDRADQSIWVTDYNNSCVVHYAVDGSILSVWPVLPSILTAPFLPSSRLPLIPHTNACW